MAASVAHPLILEEIKEIVANGGADVHSYWKADFIVNGETISAQKILEFVRDRDYLRNFTEEATLKFLMGPGTYNTKLFPYRRDIKVKLYRYSLSEVSEGSLKGSAIEVRTYKVVFYDNRSASLEALKNAAANSETADRTELREYQFQLIDPVIEQLHLKRIEAIFRECSAEAVLRGVLTKETLSVAVEAAIAPLGVEMVTANNADVRSTVIIKPNTRLVDLPKYLQNNCGGLYTTGIAGFYQNRHWYVFPPYDVTRYRKSKSTLTIARIAGNEMRGLERTYRKVNNSLFVISTGELKHNDPSEEMQLTDGNGVRFLRAGAVMDGFSTTTGNKAKVDRSANVNELLADENPTGYQQVNQGKITDNVCSELSKLAARKGSYVQLTWENSDPDLLFPGMPTRILYNDNGNLYSLEGALIAAEHYSVLYGTVGTGRRHVCNSALTFFVTRTEIDQGRGK